MKAKPSRHIHSGIPVRDGGGSRSMRQNWRLVILATGLVLAYLLLDWIAHTNTAGHSPDTPWNPPPGIALAGLLIAGLAWTPVLFIAALLSELWVRDMSATPAQAVLLATVVTTGYTALAGLLRSGFLAIDWRQTQMRDMILFVLCTTAVTLLIAGGYVLLLQSDLGTIWHLGAARHLLRYWIGDLIGVLVFAPLILLLCSGRMRFAQRRRDAFAHGFGIFLAIIFALWVVYGNVPSEQITSLYLMFLPLIWASLRFGLSGAIIATVVLQVGVIALSHLGSQSDATVLQFQIRLLAIAVTGLFLGMAVDELHSTAQKLRERQAELDRSLRLAASAELASAMAHELNQPLSAIGIYTRSCEILLRERPVPELSETMAKIGVEVRRAGDVVHRLREFYRSGGSKLDSVAPVELLRAAVETLQERAARHRIAIEYRVESGLPTLSIERVQIATVLHNLLSNAIEAIRDAGSMRREVAVSARSGRDGMVTISVADTGPGIDADEVENLFRPFRSTKNYGLGLGLSMSYSIIAAHGGTLRIAPVSVGCCFELTLPVTIQEKE